MSSGRTKKTLVCAVSGSTWIRIGTYASCVERTNGARLDTKRSRSRATRPRTGKRNQRLPLSEGKIVRCQAHFSCCVGPEKYGLRGYLGDGMHASTLAIRPSAYLALSAALRPARPALFPPASL